MPSCSFRSITAVILLAVVASWGPGCDTEEPDPPPDPDGTLAHLSLVSATIEEQPPVTAEVLGRTVRLSIVVEGAPPCDADSGDLRYGFLFDVDHDEATGAADDAFAGLGVDARLEVHCDPASGTLQSSVGAVEVVDTGAGHEVRVETTVEQLPGLELEWAAYAFQDETFVRLPESPHAALWATVEIGGA